jgi:plastocyanin
MRRGAVLLTLALLAGCGDSDPSPPTARDLAEVDLSPDHTITVDEDGYEPAELEVRSGEVVLLVNAGDEAHSFSTDEGELETGRMEPGDETTLVLTEPQVVRFHDSEAPEHEGTLTVRPQ